MTDPTKSKNRFLEDIVVRLFGKTELSLSYKNPQKVADEDYKRIEEYMKNIQWLSGDLTRKELDSIPKKEKRHFGSDINQYDYCGLPVFPFPNDDGAYWRVRDIINGYAGVGSIPIPRRDYSTKRRVFCKSKLNLKVIKFRDRYLLIAKVSDKSKTYTRLGALDSIHFNRDWLLTYKDNDKNKLVLRGMEK